MRSGAKLDQEDAWLPIPLPLPATAANPIRPCPAGVSVLSWSTYLASALLWLWYGVGQRDKNIYLPCIGWIGLDAGVIAGVMQYG